MLIDARAGRREVGAGQPVHGEVVGAAGREQRPAAVVPPRADDRRQAGDRPHGHPAAVVALHAVVEPDQRRLLAGQAMGEASSIVSTSTPVIAATFSGGYSSRTRSRSSSAPTVAAFEVVVVLEAVAPDDVHQAQGERGVGAGAGLDVPVGAAGGRAPVGVDRDDRRAGLAGLDHQAPEVAVGVGGVRAPVDDELALRARPAGRPRAGRGPSCIRSPARRPWRRSSGRASRRPAGGRTAGRGCSTGACPSSRSSCRAGSPAGRRPSGRSRRIVRRSSSRASSQVIGSNRPSPLRPTRFIGWSKPIGAVDPVEVPGHLLAEEPARERDGRDRPAARRPRRP